MNIELYTCILLRVKPSLTQREVYTSKLNKRNEHVTSCICILLFDINFETLIKIIPDNTIH